MPHILEGRGGGGLTTELLNDRGIIPLCKVVKQDLRKCTDLASEIER